MAEQNIQEKGTISIHTENIFPIIKKFLYSDQEIFLRELVSNGVDAVQKLKRLASLGEYKGELEEGKVSVSVDKEAKKITVSDTGIGMTAEEIKKYINQIAFSGAEEFVQKYKEAEDNKSIIGHFGLGFYSAFMVANKVEIITKSYREVAEAARWECEGNTEFEIAPAVKKEVGTDIVLHINEDAEEFLESHRLRSILDKYCAFLPVPIEFEEEQINEPKPIWTKSPSELSDEDYKAFYKSLYPTAQDPLFWIHLNVDYPFELTGVLYFPKVTQDIAENRHKIQLYSRQVFITDDVRDVVPEFLTLLHGVIDSPDIPLNVSRSYLQSDSNVRKITGHITKKVADKLQELFKQDRSNYESKWEDVGLFVKYGMVADQKFADKAKDFVLLKDTEGKYYTLEEYKEKVKEQQTDKDGNTVYLYTPNKEEQHSFVDAAEEMGYNVLLMDGMVDNHFITHLENQLENTSLKRVDADAPDQLINKGDDREHVLSADQQEALKQLFQKVSGDENLSVDIRPMDPNGFPVRLTEAEFMRRMKEMSQMMGSMPQGMPNQQSLVLNGNHELVADLASSKDENQATYLFELAKLMSNQLKGQELTDFAKRSLAHLKN